MINIRSPTPPRYHRLGPLRPPPFLCTPDGDGDVVEVIEFGEDGVDIPSAAVGEATGLEALKCAMPLCSIFKRRSGDRLIGAMATVGPSMTAADSAPSITPRCVTRNATGRIARRDVDEGDAGSPLKEDVATEAVGERDDGDPSSLPFVNGGGRRVEPD